MLALHDRIFVVQQWCLLRSATAVRRSFRNRDPRYHGKNLPSLQSIRNVINHFKAHGTVTDLRKTTAANKKRQIPEEDVRSVKRLYYWKQRFSVKRASVKTGLSRYRVRKILTRIIKKKPYKPEKKQETNSDKSFFEHSFQESCDWKTFRLALATPITRFDSGWLLFMAYYQAEYVHILKCIQINRFFEESYYI
jgi:hypothetical protein